MPGEERPQLADEIVPHEDGVAWIDTLSDDQCLEVFWLYLEDPDAFFARYPKPLLGQALRYALREVIRTAGTPPRNSGA